MTDGIDTPDIPVRVHRRKPEPWKTSDIVVMVFAVIALAMAIAALALSLAAAHAAAPQGRYTLTITHTMGESTTPGLTAMECQHAVMSAQVTVARLPGAQMIRASCVREALR